MTTPPDPIDPAPALALTKSIADYQRLTWDTLAPAHAHDLWDWCVRHLIMPDGTKFSARRGRLFRRFYRLTQARLTGVPCPQDPEAHQCEQLWLVLAAQLAKSTFLRSILLWSYRNHPLESGLVMQRLKDLSRTRKTRLQRSLLKTAVLERLLPQGEDARREALSADTWTIGSSLTHFLCANVSDDLRMLALALALVDEFGAYPKDVEGDGCPLELIISRQRTLPGTRLIVGGTTPGDIDGHGWARLCSGSHERPLITCPHCHGYQWIDWRRVSLVDGIDLKEVPPDRIITDRLARYACPWCGTLLTAEDLDRAITRCADRDDWCPGTWAITAQSPGGDWKPADGVLDANGRAARLPPGRGTIRSAWASSIYSIDENLHTYAKGLAIMARSGLTVVRTRTNNDLCEPASQVLTKVVPELLAATTRPTTAYRFGSLPFAAPYLILFFDQQGNQRDKFWFPWVLRAFAPGKSWLVDSGTAANPSERDALEDRAWTINGEARQPDLVGMDSANGNARWDIYVWAAARPDLRVLVRGDTKLSQDEPWREVLDVGNHRRQKAKPAGVREWRVQAHHWRTRLWERMQGQPAPGDATPRHRWYLPEDAPKFYRDSLLSQEQVTERVRIPGHGWQEVVVWRDRATKTPDGKITYRTDTHWWAAEADVLALADIFGIDLPAPDEAPPPEPAPTPARPPPPAPTLTTPDGRPFNLLTR